MINVLKSIQSLARSNISIKLKLSSQRDIQRFEASSYWSHEWAFQCNFIAFYRIDRLVRNEVAILTYSLCVDFVMLPIDWTLGSLEHSYY